MKNHIIYISIIIAILIGGYLLWPKPQPADPLIEILQQQTKTDSIRIYTLLQRADSISNVVHQKEQEIASLKLKTAKIEDKYNKEREKLSKLSTSEMMDSFIEQTGGKQDSIYSIPRMNLLNALEVFVCAEEQHEINTVLGQVIDKQDTTINLQKAQIVYLEQANGTLINSLDLHKKTVSLQAEKIVKLEKKIKRQAVTNKVIGGVAIVVGVLYLIK